MTVVDGALRMILCLQEPGGIVQIVSKSQEAPHALAHPVRSRAVLSSRTPGEEC